MKKLYIIFFVILIIQGSSLRSYFNQHEYLKQRLSENSKIRQECEQVSPAWFWRGDVETQCDFLEFEFYRQALIIDSHIKVIDHLEKINDEYKNVDESDLGLVDRVYRFGKIAYTMSITGWLFEFMQRLDRQAVSDQSIGNAVKVILAHESDEIKNKEYELLLLSPQSQKIEKTTE